MLVFERDRENDDPEFGDVVCLDLNKNNNNTYDPDGSSSSVSREKKKGLRRNKVIGVHRQNIAVLYIPFPTFGEEGLTLKNA